MVSGQLQRQVQSGHLVLGRQHHSWIYRHMGKCQRPNSWRQGMTVLFRTHMTTRSFHYACCLGRWHLPYCLYIPCASIPVHLTPQVCIWAHACLLYTWNMQCGCMLTLQRARLARFFFLHCMTTHLRWACTAPAPRPALPAHWQQPHAQHSCCATAG